MKILLTGATGFLGSYLLKSFLKDNYQVVVIKRSSSNIRRIDEDMLKIVYYDIDKVSLSSVFIEHKIDLIVNCANSYGRDKSSIKDLLQPNLFFPLELLDLAVKHNVKYFINSDTLLYYKVNKYALSKYQLVEWLKFYSNKLNVINIKMEHIYGSNDDENKFVFCFINQLKNNVAEINLTSGVQKRDFIYITDVVEAYMKIIEHKEQFSNFEEFELGNGNSVTVKYFLEKTYEALNQKMNLSTKLCFGMIPYRKNEVMTMEADITKLLKLGWTPKVSVEEGIQKIIGEGTL